MKMRPYQEDIVSRVLASSHRRTAMVSATGSGKTAMFAEIHRRFGKRTVFLCDRQELVDQALAHFGDEAGVMIGSSFRPGNPMVCGVFTAVRRQPTPADLVLVDECHLSMSRTWSTVTGFYPEARIVGATATLYRYGNGSLAPLFDDVVAGPSISELVALGHLCPVRTFASRDDLARSARIRAGEFVAEDLDKLMRGTVLRTAVAEWAKRATGRKTIAFCCTKAHAHDVAEAMRQYGPAEVICEDTPKDARRTARDRLTRGDLIALVSVDCLGVGFDCPAADLGLMLRPTMSRGVCRQQAGRIMRTFPGKRDALLLDMAGNVGRHGLPMSNDVTTLDGKVIPIPKRGRLLGLQNCPKCLAVFETGSACPECGTAPPKQKRIVRTVKGTLDEIVGVEATGADEYAARASALDWAMTIGKWRRIGWSEAKIHAVRRSMIMRAKGMA